MSANTLKYLARLYFIAALLVITWLATTRTGAQGMGLPWDKLNHLGAFFLLAFLLDFGWKGYVWKWLSLLGYGFVIEIAQWLSGYRFFEWADLFADSLGIGLYLLFRDRLDAVRWLMLKQDSTRRV